MTHEEERGTGRGRGFHFYLPILLKYGTICGLRQRWRRSTQALEVVRYGTNCAEAGKELALVVFKRAGCIRCEEAPL